MKKRGRPKASKREDGVDLIGSMPDVILLLILSRLSSTEEVIRTSILSRRWRYLWTSVPSLDLSYPDRDDRIVIENESNRHKFTEYAYWVLANKSVDLNSFTLCCYDHYSTSTVWRWIHLAVRRNVKQLDLTFEFKESNDDIEMPHFLVTCCSLEVLKLCLFERVLKLPNFIGFPALRVLELNYVVLVDENLVKAFFESCPLLENLSLVGCFINGFDVLCISCPKLMKLEIKDEEILRISYGIKICCPKLMFLELTGPIADNFFFESLDSLKEAVIGLDELPGDEIESNTTNVLLPGISHVESLKINFYFFSQCIKAACDPGLPNLKNLELITTIAAFTFDEFIQILKYYPKLESFKLLIREDFNSWKERKLDEAETRNILNPDLKRVQCFEFNGQKPKLVLDHGFPFFGSKFMEMVLSWGNKANYSH